MDFLKIAVFVVVLFGILIWRLWGSSSSTVQPEGQVVLETGVLADIVEGVPAVEVITRDQTANAKASGVGDLQIDGHPIIAVTSIANPHVIDGDSIRANGPAGQVEFRLASIDAPEFNQPFGRRSKQYLQTIVARKTLTAYQTDTDRYGRKVAFVFATIPGRPAEEVNAKMVADGYAWHAIKHSQNTTLARLQNSARVARLGLWDQPVPTPPWEYRDAGSAANTAVASRP